VRALAKGRFGRIVGGWSANLIQTFLGVVQQVALVPVFLYFWNSDVLAAWLALYSVGYLVLAADFGLQMRAINRFLALRACADPDGRTAQFFSATLRIYIGLAAAVAIAILIGSQFLSPSVAFGFSTAHFDLAFVVMTLGMILTLPTNLASALYRARGYYGRIVKIQCWSMIVAQIGQLVAVATTQSLLAVTLAYAAAQVTLVIYIFYHDLPLLFDFLRKGSSWPSWRWAVGQFRRAFPFAIVMASENAISYAPLLLVSVFVTDRVAVVQWGLTKVIAGLVRGLSFQMTLPLAAELGHDHAIGERERLRILYARGSILVSLLAAIIVSGLLPFWPDFFALWTHNAVPYDAVLTVTLLIGTSIIAPSIMALSYANYTDHGRLLAWIKGLQLLAFVATSLVLIPLLGPLGAAIAIVSGDLLLQFGVLTFRMLSIILRNPVRHMVFVIALIAFVTALGWGLGSVIRAVLPGNGLPKFVLECGLWSVIMALFSVPLWNPRFRNRVAAGIPH